MSRPEAEMIDCKEAERRLHRFVDRELDDEQAAQVKQHLDACDNCRARFRFEAGLKRLIRQSVVSETTSDLLRDQVRRLGRHSSRSLP